MWDCSMYLDNNFLELAKSSIPHCVNVRGMLYRAVIIIYVRVVEEYIRRGDLVMLATNRDE